MSKRVLILVLTLAVLLLSVACQEDGALSKPGAPVSLSPLPPTETPLPVAEPPGIPVPQGKPTSIDGTISPGEWVNAAVESFRDGSELLLMYSEGFLYLGIRANTSEMIVGNVFIDRGDEIAILHSSAALGTAIYQEELSSWGRIQDFVWRCRGTDISKAAEAERVSFLQEEDWIAANARMGSPNELEYQIALTGETLRLAVSFIVASNPDVKIPWPGDLNDDCIKPTPGGMPAQLNFIPEKWATIALPSSEGK